jgi:hypothetical protein
MQDRKQKTSQDNECATCLGTHDQATHDATVSIRLWLRDRITSKLMPARVSESRA